MSNLKDLQKFAEEHPNQIHPDFDTIIHLLSKLENTNKLILANAGSNPDLADLISEVTTTLNEAQLDLYKTAILDEELPDERTVAGDNE